jgi:hypothetical protein
MGPEPLTIQGPAILTFGAQVFYSQADVTVTLKRESFNPVGAFSGPLGERHKSASFEISFTPVGQNPLAAGMVKYFPFTPANIGSSILSGALVIQSISQGKTWTYHRAGISKLPDLILHPLKTLFGPMTFTAIGKASTAPTDATFMATEASLAFSDVTYDPDKIVTEQYTAAWGATPYDVMGSHDGFTIRQNMGVKNLESADRGITNIILESLGAEVEFAPSNLTRAQVDTLLAFQDAAVILPGASYAGAKEDLIITGGTSLVVTVVDVGPKEGGYKHQLGENEVQSIKFVNQLKFTAGVGQRLVTFTDVV